MTQSALAEAVGCKQSAISMLESGMPEKLSHETIGKIAALLGVTLEAGSALSGSVGTMSGAPRAGQAEPGFCPSSGCPSNVPYAVGGELLFWPRPQPAGAAGPRCAYCGEVLERGCPHCGAALAEGACCHLCGGSKVVSPLPQGADAEAWAARRRAELAALKGLVT